LDLERYENAVMIFRVIRSRRQWHGRVWL